MQLRTYLYSQVGLASPCRVLEVGCGTGAISEDFSDQDQITYVGLDVNFQRLSFAKSASSSIPFLDADAYSLPFPDHTFDFVITHYLFLWLAHPQAALSEMVRVLHPLGSVLALAEPDYGSRIDEPEELAMLGKAQLTALKTQGANPLIGRSLPGLFARTGLTNVHFGCPGFQLSVGSLPNDFDLEWQILEEDLHASLSTADLARYKGLDKKAWLDGSRVLWVPTFYALGTKDPKSHAINH